MGGISRKSYAKAWTNSDARSAGFEGIKLSNWYCERIQNPSRFLWLQKKKKKKKLWIVPSFRLFWKNININPWLKYSPGSTLSRGKLCCVEFFHIKMVRYSYCPVKGNPDPEIREIVARRIHNPGNFAPIWNSEYWALESGKWLKKSESHNDRNPESNFHWQRLESNTWNPESPAWISASKTCLDSLTMGRFLSL